MKKVNLVPLFAVLTMCLSAAMFVVVFSLFVNNWQLRIYEQELMLTPSHVRQYEIHEFNNSTLKFSLYDTIAHDTIHVTPRHLKALINLPEIIE